jgi:hypothetical protein
MLSRRDRCLIALLAVLAAAAPPGFSAAQRDVPTREGDTWDWRDHEPDPSMVRQEEKAAGITSSSPQRQKADDEVESLYKQLMQDRKNAE